MIQNLAAIFLSVLISYSAYAQDEVVGSGSSKVQEAEESADKGEQVVPEEPLMSREDLLKAQADDVVIGDDTAPVTIIEYASMSCSHCAAFHNETYPALKEKYIDTGKVRFIFRDFPLDKTALTGSLLARCVADDKERFSKYIKVMFSTQSNWAPKSNYIEVLSNIAKLGGMSGEEFEACMADKDNEAKILSSRYLAGKVLEVRSTPTLFINGVLHKGSQSIEYVSKEVDALLAQ